MALLFLAAGISGPATGAETETAIIDIPNAIRIDDGILGGGQPTEAALQQAADAGYRTIVNMRLIDEQGMLAGEAEFVRSLGMDYVELPISGGDAFTEINAKRLAEILAEPSALPAVVHCRSGNRVGILFAVKAFYLDGLDGPAALKFGKEAGARRFPEQVQALLGGDSED
jgi:protein tyrosine phosphatase (PTP) superfamily phosphohydrolase (DUF442 family)